MVVCLTVTTSYNFFRGKIDYSIVTTLRSHQITVDNPSDAEWDMPNYTEIKLFMLDNRKCVQGYRIVKNDERRPESDGSGPDEVSLTIIMFHMVMIPHILS